MRQHVNPLSNHFKVLEPIPPLDQLFKNPHFPLHIDIGCASGNFLFELAKQNHNWNYLGIEIREKLVLNAKLKLKYSDLENLSFFYGNADYAIKESVDQFPNGLVNSVSFNFPDPWFKKKHHKRRVLQPELLDQISKIMTNNALLFIKSDVNQLFEYMNSVILGSCIFEKYNNEFENTHNPQNIKTERELYAISQNLPVYNQIYRKTFNN